jgi:hypothetical protein
MKNKVITMAAVMLALGSSAQAQTDVYVTGATAFRSATLNTIRTIFANSGQYKIVHNGGSGSYNGSTYAIIQGTFSNVPGTTTIYTSFNGSVEGIRALATTNNNPEYLLSSVLTNATNFIPQNTIADGVSGISNPRAASASDFAFSDVSKASTPFGSASLLPATPQVGVVTFSMVANRGTTNAIDNLNTQNFRALLGRGYVPRKLITGDSSDTNGVVYVMGRNDGSGTRTTYAAETGYGIATPMNQYIMGAASGGSITDIYLVPAGGTNNALNGPIASNGLGLTGDAKNASTVWNQNFDGNGGYNSGGTLVGVLTNTSPSVNVYDAQGLLFEANQNISVVSFLSTGDTKTALAGGAIALGYNGVKLSGFATNGGTLTPADTAKITQGAYTAWGYQYFYRLPTITTGTKATVYDLMFSNIPNNLGSAGIAKSLMSVARSVDGGVVVP